MKNFFTDALQKCFMPFFSLFLVFMLLLNEHFFLIFIEFLSENFYLNSTVRKAMEFLWYPHYLLMLKHKIELKLYRIENIKKRWINKYLLVALALFNGSHSIYIAAFCKLKSKILKSHSNGQIGAIVVKLWKYI